MRANAEKDMETMSRLMAHDADITSYTIGGRKYVGWGDLERDMEEEFKSAATIEIPIRELKVWTRGDLAWYAMEVDYIRTVTTGSQPQRACFHFARQAYWSDETDTGCCCPGTNRFAPPAGQWP